MHYRKIDTNLFDYIKQMDLKTATWVYACPALKTNYTTILILK